MRFGSMGFRNLGLMASVIEGFRAAFSCLLGDIGLWGLGLGIPKTETFDVGIRA